MSFMNDDAAICDRCCEMFPDGYPDRFYAPWPVARRPGPGQGPPDGRPARQFHLCESCLQDLVLRARLPLDGRELAMESRARWLASQRLLTQAEDVVKGPRPAGRQDAA